MILNNFTNCEKRELETIKSMLYITQHKFKDDEHIFESVISPKFKITQNL